MPFEGRAFGLMDSQPVLLNDAVSGCHLLESPTAEREVRQQRRDQV